MEGQWTVGARGLVSKFRLASKIDGAELSFNKRGCETMSTALEDMAERLDFYEQRDRRHPILSGLMDLLDCLRAGRQK